MRSWMLAEFATREGLIAAAEEARTRGYDAVDAHSPYPIGDEGYRALGLRKPIVPWLVFFGGFGGATLGYLMQWWCNAVDYPINVGGRPLHSAPAFIPITFEMGILFAALTAFLGCLALNKLPQLYHPAYEVDDFRSATDDKFWLSVQSDAGYDEALMHALEEKGALSVHAFEERP